MVKHRDVSPSRRGEQQRMCYMPQGNSIQTTVISATAFLVPALSAQQVQ